jgi:ATP-dependent DNA ligase
MTATFIKPMLCQTWEDAGWPAEGWIAEPKLDGQRALVYVEKHQTVAVFSRLGNDSLGDEGLAWLRAVKWKHPTMILDAELYVGGGNGAAPEVSRSKAGGTSSSAIACFDQLAIEGSLIVSSPWRDRRAVLEQTLKGQKHPQIQLTVTSREPAKLWAAWTKVGGEGVILKRPDSTYQIGRRSPDWMKRKVWMTVDVVITGVTNKPTYTRTGYAGGNWALTYGFYEPDQGKVVQSGQGLKVGKKDVLEKLIGQIAEVKCCAVMETGGLRHAGFLRWRADKRVEECTRP